MSDNENKSQRKIKCPQCGLLTVYSLENDFRPFCSERCKLIDLGAWADESYKIPSSDSLTIDEEDDLDADHEH